MRFDMPFMPATQKGQMLAKATAKWPSVCGPG